MVAITCIALLENWSCGWLPANSQPTNAVTNQSVATTVLWSSSPGRLLVCVLARSFGERTSSRRSFRGICFVACQFAVRNRTKQLFTRSLHLHAWPNKRGVPFPSQLVTWRKQWKGRRIEPANPQLKLKDCQDTCKGIFTSHGIPTGVTSDTPSKHTHDFLSISSCKISPLDRLLTFSHSTCYTNPQKNGKDKTERTKR